MNPGIFVRIFFARKFCHNKDRDNKFQKTYHKHYLNWMALLCKANARRQLILCTPFNQRVFFIYKKRTSKWSKKKK